MAKSEQRIERPESTSRPGRDSEIIERGRTTPDRPVPPRPVPAKTGGKKE